MESGYGIVCDYTVTSEQLVRIAEGCQNRTFAEEVNEIQNFKGSAGLLAALNINPQLGVQDDEIDFRRETFGSNEKPVMEQSSYCQLLCGALEDFTLRILIFAAVISIALEVGVADDEHRKTAWIEGFAILIAVAVCANVTAFNDYQKEKQFQKLNSVADSRKECTVRRNGEIVNLHQDKLLVGDIVVLTQGMEIPADGVVLEASELMCDESAMTGETDSIHKATFAVSKAKREELLDKHREGRVGRHDVPSCVLLSGTRILTGEGKMVVIVVGDQSCIGKIRAVLMQKEAEETPLQAKLQRIATDIGKFGLIAAVAVFLILMIRLGVECGIEGKWDHKTRWVEVVQHFILAVTVVVVAIPEGLPLSVTLSLAYSVTKMLKDNNLVRKIEACETMGGANNICSDKTGTLTMNKMTLTTYWNGKVEEFNLNQLSLDECKFSKRFQRILVASLCSNSSALLRPVEKGSSTEVAFLKFMALAGYNYELVRQTYPFVAKFPFSSSRKRMSVIIKYEGREVLLCKGASELVLSACDQWHQKEHDEVLPINDKALQTINGSINQMAERALRTLIIAYRVLPEGYNLSNKNELGVYQIEQSNLVLLAVLGVRDMPRPEVPKAIQDCRTANIKVRMVTGDNLVTARAIATQIGIIQPKTKSIIMEGPEFVKAVGGLVCSVCLTAVCDCPRNEAKAKEMDRPQRIDTIANKEEFNRIVEHLDVLARSRPQDKYLLVTGLSERGDVVAVTGDGTNDAPALKRADIGIAMGISGTEVAREAAAIILLDDNFRSIVKAVKWGRNIYDSIRKFIQFQLTVNVVAVAVTMIGSALFKQELLSAIQMLWVNLIMDTFASLALATEPPSPEQLRRKPQSRDEYIVSPTMIKHILGQALYQIAVICLICFYGPYFIPEDDQPARQQLMLQQLASRYPNSTAYYPGYSPRHLFGNVSLGLIHKGNNLEIDGKTFVYKEILTATGVYSRHFTMIFNTFVCMQIFNFLNSRKLSEEYNILGGITRNPIFIGIVLLIAAFQGLIVTFTSNFFQLYSTWGLNGLQWLICIGFGAGGLVVSALLKFLPLAKVQEAAPKVQKKKKKKTKEMKSERKVHLEKK